LSYRYPANYEHSMILFFTLHACFLSICEDLGFFWDYTRLCTFLFIVLAACTVCFEHCNLDTITRHEGKDSFYKCFNPRIFVFLSVPMQRFCKKWLMLFNTQQLLSVSYTYLIKYYCLTSYIQLILKIYNILIKCLSLYKMVCIVINTVIVTAGTFEP
jgi:hypothetical protein